MRGVPWQPIPGRNGIELKPWAMMPKRENKTRVFYQSHCTRSNIAMPKGNVSILSFGNFGTG